MSELKNQETLLIYVDGLFQENNAKLINYVSDIDVPSEPPNKRWTAYRDITKSYPVEIQGIPFSIGRTAFLPTHTLYIFGKLWWSAFYFTHDIQNIFIDIDYPSILGDVLILDCANPETYSVFARNYAVPLQRQNTSPTVIAANKYGHPDMWTIEDLKLALHIADDIPIVACDIETGEGVIDVFVKLCEEYLQQYYS